MSPFSSLSFILALVALVLSIPVRNCNMLPSKVLHLERAFPVDQPVDMELLRDRDRARHTRFLRGMVEGVVDFPAEGCPDPLSTGLYFTTIKLGSPPSEFRVQIDTGSDVLWIACNSCTNCPRTSGLNIKLEFFDVASSSTSHVITCSDPMCTSGVPSTTNECISQSNQCGYAFQYGDGSGTSGFYVSDLLHFDMILNQSYVINSSAPVIFGCSTYQWGGLTKTDKAIDGILGFGRGDLSIMSQLSSRGIIPNVFSHCLKGDGNGGGIVVLGKVLEPTIVYTPLFPSRSHYNLHMESIAINDQVLPIDPTVFTASNNQGTIVDSGTTLAYLMEGAFNPLVNEITTVVTPYTTPTISKGRQCYLANTSVSKVFPTISLNFVGGTSMLLKPEEYLLHVGFVNSYVLWCIGFESIQEGLTILGDLFLKDKIIVYDLVEEQIGWANYDCSLPMNVSGTYGKDGCINYGQLFVNRSSDIVDFYVLLIILIALCTHLFFSPYSNYVQHLLPWLPWKASMSFL